MVSNLKGAFWSLMVGLLTGVIRMVLDFIYVEPACGEEDTRPSIIKDVTLNKNYPIKKNTSFYQN